MLQNQKTPKQHPNFMYKQIIMSPQFMPVPLA